MPPADPAARANALLPAYFADYEARFALPIRRPVRVRRVERIGEPGRARGFLVRTDGAPGTWRADFVVNATGTWTQPHLPYYPGIVDFRGEQLHTVSYPGPEHFHGLRVVVANEGEPAEDYSADPEGSVSVIDVSGGVAEVTQADVMTAGFGAFADRLDPAVRVIAPWSDPAPICP